MQKRTGTPKICDVRKEAADKKREIFLIALREGATIKQACRSAGWASATSWENHKKTYPDWAALCQLAMRSARQDPDASKEDFASFPWFVGEYFPDRHEHTATQLRIVQELEHLESRDVVLVNIFPEAGKTAVIEDFICKELARDPSLRFRYMSEGTNLSKRVVGTAKRRMTDLGAYGKFIARFGPFYNDNQERHGRPWSTEEITLAKNPGTERDRNLVASSITSTVLGSRIDVLIIDDVMSHRNYAQAEEIVRKIRGTFFTRGFKMKTIIIGNRIGPGDVYERLLDSGLITREVTIRAADIHGNPTDDAYWEHDLIHNGGPCCKNFRVCPNDGSKVTPRQYMELIRHQVQEEQWFSMYQQNPQADERTTFSEYVDACLDRERVTGQMPKGVAA